jgi:integrase
VPIGTTRLRTLLEYLRIDGEGKEKRPDTFVFTRGDDAAVKSFRTAWEATRESAKLTDIRFHDLRSEYASRLVEKGVPPSKVRDLLGHCSIVVTERYDRQVLATLKEAVGAGRRPIFQYSVNLERSASPVKSVSSSH